jgi:hypothetical protein
MHQGQLMSPQFNDVAATVSDVAKFPYADQVAFGNIAKRNLLPLEVRCLA